MGISYKNHIKTLDLKGNERVLDFGIGSAACSKHHAKILQKGNGYLTCADTSEYFTAKAKKGMKDYKNAEFLTGYLPEIKLSENSFNVNNVFLHYMALQRN